MRSFVRAHIITCETRAGPIGFPGPQAPVPHLHVSGTLCSDLWVLCVSRCISGSSQPFHCARATLATLPQPRLAPVPRPLQTEVVTRSSIPLKSLWLLAAFALLFGSRSIRAQESAPIAKPDGQTRNPGDTRPNRAPGNAHPLRGQWRLPQRGPYPRPHQQRTRRPPILAPQFQLQPLLRADRNPARSHHSRQRRHRRHPPQRHHRPTQPDVADAPAYQDVRVKSVRILGLEPADVLEYRVITTATHRPSRPTSGSTTPSTAPASSPRNLRTRTACPPPRCRRRSRTNPANP